MGNIAGSSENNLTFFQNQSSNFSAVKSKSYIDEPRINNDVDYAFEGTYYKSNRRVAPIYMANPYQPDSMDRAEIWKQQYVKIKVNLDGKIIFLESYINERWHH